MKLQMDKPVHTNPSGHKENLKNRDELVIRCSKVNETINHVIILIKTLQKRNRRLKGLPLSEYISTWIKNAKRGLILRKTDIPVGVKRNRHTIN